MDFSLTTSFCSGSLPFFLVLSVQYVHFSLFLYILKVCTLILVFFFLKFELLSHVRGSVYTRLEDYLSG